MLTPSERSISGEATSRRPAGRWLWEGFNRLWGAVRSCWRALVGLVSSWWRVDRIRVSPREGRLLRLEPPCIVRIHGDLLEVTHRHVGHGTTGKYVSYNCGAGELRVFPVGGDLQPVVHLLCGDRRTVLAADDIEVYC